MQGEQKIFNIGYPYIAHLCAGKGAKELSVNDEVFYHDTYHYFRRSAKKNLKKQLREFMFNFKNNEVRKVINHVSTR